MQSAQMSISARRQYQYMQWFGFSTRSRILNGGACCFLPKLRAELQVSHIRIIANQTYSCLLFCARSSSLSLVLDACTLTLRLNPEPQALNPKP